MGIVNRDDALYWATGIDTSGLDVDAKKMEQIFADMEADTGASVNKMKQNLDASMNFQRQIIKKLESELKGLEDAYSKASVSGYQTEGVVEQRKKEKRAISELRAEIQAEKDDLKAREQVMELLSKKQATITTRMNNLRNEMAAMRAQGLQNTEQYRDMSVELEKLSVISRQVKVEQQNMLKGNNLQGVLAGLNGLAGVFSAGAGAMGLLNVESKNYEKIQARVQSMIAITIGLQQTYNAVSQAGAFRVQVFSKAVSVLNTQFKIGVGLSKLLVSSGIGILLAGIASLVVLYDKWKKKQEEINALKKEFSDVEIGAVRAMADSKTKVEQLHRIASDYNKTLDVRNRAIREMKSMMPEYNGYIDKEGKLIDNASTSIKKYIESLYNLEKAKEIFAKMKEIDVQVKEKEEEEVKEPNFFQKSMAAFASAMDQSGTLTYDSILADMREQNKKAKDAMIQDLKNKKEEFNKEFDSLVDNKSTFENLFGSKNKKGAGRTPEDLSLGVVEAQLKLDSERISIMKDGKEKRLKLSEQEWKEEQARLDREHEDRKKKYREQGKSMTQSEIDIYNERKKISDKAKSTRDSDIEKEFKKELVSTYKELSDVFLSEEDRKKNAIIERYKEERELAKKKLDTKSITEDEYKTLVSEIDKSETEEHRKRMLDGLDSFKRQEEEITKFWNKKIQELENDKTLNENKRIEAIKTAKKRYNDELNELNAQALTQSEEWVALFSDTASLTSKEIDDLIKSIKSKIRSGEYKLNPVDSREFISSLESARDGMKNPLDRMISSFEAYLEARKKQKEEETKLLELKETGGSDEAIKNATENVKGFKKEAQDAAAGVASSFADANQLISSIGESVVKVVDSFGGDTRQIENVTNLLGGVATAGQGIAKIASGDIIGGISDAVKGLADVIVSINGISDTERQKRIEKLAKSVEKAKKKYEELGEAREKAFSNNKAKVIEDQNKLIDQQIRDLDAMISEEEKKKKTDNGAIEQMRAQQNELRKQQRENREAAKEAIVGTDIMSAIDQFAQAYADAWASGERGAENSVKAIKNIIRGGLMEALKGGIKNDAQRVYDAINDALKNDNRISEAEERNINSIAEAMTRNAEKYRSALEPYLDKESQSGVTGELKKEMTEGTASQLVGLWHMTAMDIRALKEYFEHNPINGFERELRETLDMLSSIDRNTRETADNTDGLREELIEMGIKLEDIKNNTKNNNSRG